MMTNIWYVFYDNVPNQLTYKSEAGVELFTDELQADQRYHEISEALFKEAQFFSGETMPDWPAFYEDVDPVAGTKAITYLSNLALKIGKAVWK